MDNRQYINNKALQAIKGKMYDKSSLQGLRDDVEGITNACPFTNEEGGDAMAISNA